MDQHRPTDRLERFLLILLMANLAIAQPLFDLLGRQAEFLVAHNVGSGDLIGLTLLLSLIIPSLLALLPLLASSAAKQAGDIVFFLLFVILATLVFMPLMAASGLEGLLSIIVAVLLAIGLGLLYRSYPPLRLFFKYLAPAVIVLPLIFLFYSRATPLLHQADTEEKSGVSLASRPDIVFIILDEFPLVSLLNGDLQIDRERYPNFARLADISSWYPAATTGAVVTVDAVPQALTGINPEPNTEKLPIALHYPNNLFTLLQNDYRIDARETATRLCPRQVCNDRQTSRDPVANLAEDLMLVYRHLVTPAPWVHQLPSISDGWSGFGKNRPLTPDRELEEALGTADLAGQMSWNSRSSQFREFINSIQTGETPGLYYLHSLLPHRIWRYLPDGRQFIFDEVWAALDPPHSRPGNSGGQNLGHRWQFDEFAVYSALQRHLLQVMFADHLIGELLDDLQSKGMLEDSLIIVTGDHGASFVPGQAPRMITELTLSDISAIPLFIKLPGQETGIRSPLAATLADILPTIADVLGSSGEWSGQSLLSGQHEERDTITLLTASGHEFSYPLNQHLEHLAGRARLFEFTLGRGTGPDFYRLGPNPGLLATRPEQHPALAPGMSDSVILDSPEMYQNVQPDSQFIPLHVSGRLQNTDTAKPPIELAVAVNGTIQALSQTYVAPEFRDRFAALLPVDALRSGHNAIEIYRVEHKTDGIALVRLRQQAESGLSLVGKAGQESLTDRAGNRWPVNPETGKGHVLTLTIEGQAFHMLNGSLSADLSPDSRIAAFLNGKFLAGTSAADSFFIIPLPGREEGGKEQPSLRVFALGEHEAWELGYPEPCSEQWHYAAPVTWSDTICDLAAVDPLKLEDGRYRAMLDFREQASRPFLARGFEFNPGKVAWSTGQRAELVFPLSRTFDELSFTATIMPFLSKPALEEQRVYLLANDEKIAQWSLSDSGFKPINWAVPRRILESAGSELVLSFLTPDAASPKSLDAGEDLRILGLAFLSLEISGKETPP